MQFRGFRPAILLKKETQAQVFSCEFCETSGNTFFTEHLWVIASVNRPVYEENSNR